MAYAAATFADFSSFDDRSFKLGPSCRAAVRGIAFGLGGLTAIGATIGLVTVAAAWIMSVCLAVHPDLQTRTSFLKARGPAFQVSLPAVAANAPDLHARRPARHAGRPIFTGRRRPRLAIAAPVQAPPAAVEPQAPMVAEALAPPERPYKAAGLGDFRPAKVLTQTADARDFTLDAEATFVAPLSFAPAPSSPAPAPILAAAPASVPAAASPRAPHLPVRVAERANSTPSRSPHPVAGPHIGTKHENAPAPPATTAPEVTASLPQGHDESPLRPEANPRTAIYDIEAHTVYLPDGRRLEAHSGLGRMLDDPHYVYAKARGATPPNVYELSLRQGLFHGVQALRLNPVNGSKMFGRDGILAHTYMLGPTGQSFGCVSFRDYRQFLQAFLDGEINRLVVVPHLESAPAGPVRARRTRDNGYSFNDRRKPNQPGAPSTAIAFISIKASARSKPATRTPVAAG